MKEWAFDIVDNGFMDPKRRDSDDHWLGHGIYFYPCYEEAKRWAVSKSKKYKTNYDVVVADMNKEKLYNLEDSAHLRKFKKFALDLDKMIKSDGICLDFTKGLNRNSKDFSIQVTKRKRCLHLILSQINFKLQVLCVHFVWICNFRLITKLIFF